MNNEMVQMAYYLAQPVWANERKARARAHRNRSLSLRALVAMILSLLS
jgi:hypothetical protein